MIVVPGLLHIVIPAIRLIHNKIQVVIINNGLSRKDCQMMKKSVPNVIIFKLFTDRIMGQQMTETHPEVLNTIIDIKCNKIIFVDADCYIFNTEIIDKVFKELEKKVFASPFIYENKEINQKIPETFLIGINKKSYLYLRKNMVFALVILT